MPDVVEMQSTKAAGSSDVVTANVADRREDEHPTPRSPDDIQKEIDGAQDVMGDKRKVDQDWIEGVTGKKLPVPNPVPEPDPRHPKKTRTPKAGTQGSRSGTIRKALEDIMGDDKLGDDVRREAARRLKELDDIDGEIGRLQREKKEAEKKASKFDKGGKEDRPDDHPHDGGAKTERISPAGKKRLAEVVHRLKLTPDEIRDLGEWLKKNHKAGETRQESDPHSKKNAPGGHDHLDDPDGIEAAVERWRQERVLGGKGSGGGGKPSGSGSGKSPGGGSRPKGGTSNSSQGAKGGATAKKGGTQAEGGAKDGGAANKPKGGSKAEPGAKGGAKGGSKADPERAAKFSNATLNAASRKFSGMMRDSRARFDELAKTDPAAKEIVDALDKVGLLQDAESFAKNPKGFTASQAKNALIEAPFNHFGGVLGKMMADFEAKYPDVASLNAAPLLNGASLVQLRQQYEKAMAQLRVPRSRAALIKVFFVIGVNDKTPPDQIKARLKAADKAIAQQPGLKPYVDAYYAAYDAYGVALGMANNTLTDLEQSYTREVSQLAASLRVRAAALDRVSTNLKGVADWIMDSPFIFFAPGEEAWFTFDTLASRFGAFGSRLDGFANAVDARKTDYPAEMKRLEAAGKAMVRSLSSLM